MTHLDGCNVTMFTLPSPTRGRAKTRYLAIQQYSVAYESLIGDIAACSE